MTSKSHYDVLGVARHADATVVQAAYRALAKLHHPDVTRGPKDLAAARFRAINEAYELLSDARRRAKYDAQLDASMTEPQAPPPPRPTPEPPRTPETQPQPHRAASERKPSPHIGTGVGAWLTFAVLFVLGVFAVDSWPTLRVPFIAFMVGIFAAMLKFPLEAESGSAPKPRPKPAPKPRPQTTRGLAIAKGVIAAIELLFWGAVGLLLIPGGIAIVVLGI